MRNYYIVVIFLLLNRLCVYAQKPENLYTGLSGKVASMTLIEYQGSLFDTLTNIPYDNQFYARKTIEFFHKNGNLDSTVSYCQSVNDTAAEITCRTIFSYNDQQQLQSKKRYSPGRKSGSNEQFTWIDPYTCYSVIPNYLFGILDSTILDTTLVYFDRQMNDSLHHVTLRNKQGEAIGKNSYRFDHFTNESGKGYVITFTNSVTDATYKRTTQQRSVDKFNNPTLVYLYRENGYFEAKGPSLEAVYVIAYTYYD